MAKSDLTYNTNPYMLFDQSQWSNPYSQFNNQAMPWPSQVAAGWPTDAMGNPIGGGPQVQPGMTLNQTPATPAAPATQRAAAQTGDYRGYFGNMPSLAGLNVQDPSNPAGKTYASNMTGLSPWFFTSQAPQQQQAAAAQPAAVSSNPNQLTRAQYLNLLANPGNPTNVGANVPQTGLARNDPSVMNQFLRNWQPAQSGPNSGFQQSFASALKGLGYG